LWVADEHLGADGASDHGNRKVGLANVDTVSAGSKREIDVVIHDKQRARFVKREAMDCANGSWRPSTGLVAQLRDAPPRWPGGRWPAGRARAGVRSMMT
jgi:hypothetical protein